MGNIGGNNIGKISLVVNNITVHGIPTHNGSINSTDILNVVTLVTRGVVSGGEIHYNENLTGKYDNKELLKYVKSEWIENTTWYYDKNRREYIESVVSLLPEVYQDIIESRYIRGIREGVDYTDEDVYLELNMSRSSYYIKKREALTHLGVIMLEGGIHGEGTKED